MLHVYAALAEEERALISERTRAALQAAKVRLAKEGKRLGSPVAAQTAARARAARSTYAKAASEPARAVVQDIKASGVTTLKGIAAALQARGIRTPRGNVAWAPAQVARLLG
jgi:DNA invertase Pin-like site-specific DNA recombinase